MVAFSDHLCIFDFRRTGLSLQLFCRSPIYLFDFLDREQEWTFRIHISDRMNLIYISYEGIQMSKFKISSNEYYEPITGLSLGILLLSMIFKKNLDYLVGGLLFLAIISDKFRFLVFRFIGILKNSIGKSITFLFLIITFYLVLFPVSMIRNIFSKKKGYSFKLRDKYSTTFDDVPLIKIGNDKNSINKYFEKLW